MAGVEVWRRVLPRVADDRLGLELRVAEVRERKTTLSETLSGLPADAALMGLGLAGGWGLAVVDRQLLTGLVEVQMTGRVSGAGAEARPVTHVDHALVWSVLAPWLTALSEAGAGLPAPPESTRRFPDARAAELALDDGPFRCASLTLELGGGARVGTLVLLWPDAHTVPDGDASDDIAAVVLPHQARFEAILCRVRIPLSDISSAGVGTVLPLPGASVRAITLEAPRGRVICPGHLGQSGGRRAVRIRNSASLPDLEASAPAASRAPEVEAFAPSGEGARDPRSDDRAAGEPDPALPSLGP